MKAFAIRLLFFILTGLVCLSASAHKASDAYLLLQQAAPTAPIEVKLAMALRDLDRVFDTLDANNDRALSFAEVKAALPAIERWAGTGVALRCNAQEAPLAWHYEGLEQRSDGVFIRLAASHSPCDPLKSISLRYTLMQEIDADHRAVVSWAWALSGAAQSQGSAAIQPADAWQSLQANRAQNTDASSATWATLKSFIVLGIGHIAGGADHIAFIICLVLTLALTLAREWRALLITVTAFTLGHSITLISATLGWVGSPRWVEPVIALSIAVSAAFNLIKQRFSGLQSPAISAGIAALFGLVHGLGFSGAMTEAQLPEGALLWALAGFNIGVEIGQLLIIAAWSVVYWALHRWQGYSRWVVQGGSIALIVLAMYWFEQRMGWLA